MWRLPFLGPVLSPLPKFPALTHGPCVNFEVVLPMPPFHPQVYNRIGMLDTWADAGDPWAGGHVAGGLTQSLDFFCPLKTRNPLHPRGTGRKSIQACETSLHSVHLEKVERAADLSTQKAEKGEVLVQANMDTYCKLRRESVGGKLCAVSPALLGDWAGRHCCPDVVCLGQALSSHPILALQLQAS